MIRFTTAAVVCAVAAVAAVVSYSHIYGLGRAHGQDVAAARLLPLSVDGLILAASLVLLHEARNDRDAPRLARFMLWRATCCWTVLARGLYSAAVGSATACLLAAPRSGESGACVRGVRAWLSPWTVLQRWWTAWSKAPRRRSCKR